MTRPPPAPGPASRLELQEVSLDHVGAYAHLAMLRRDHRGRLALAGSDEYAGALHMSDGGQVAADLASLQQPVLHVAPPPDLSMQWADFSAGFLAGVAGVLVGHPFDTVKVRQQVKGSQYSSLWKCTARTMQQEGMAGFYKGLLFPLLTEGGRNCLFFGVYERLKAEEVGTSVNYGSVALAGAVGGGVQAIPATPIELAKIKLQHQTEKAKAARKYRGPVHCMKDIYSQHGLQKCFRGLSVCILRDVSGFAAYMTSYEYLCRCFEARGPDHCSISVLLLTGGIAGAVSWFINLPIDYVKSRLQADSLASPRFAGAASCARAVLRESGPRVFYRGLPAVLIRAFVLNAVTLTVYSSCRFHFQNV